MLLGFPGNLGLRVRCSLKSPYCLTHSAPAKPPTIVATELPSSSPEMSRLHKTRHLSLSPYQPQLSPGQGTRKQSMVTADEPYLTSACFLKDEPRVKLGLVPGLCLPTSPWGTKALSSPLKLPIQSCVQWPSHPQPRQPGLCLGTTSRCNLYLLHQSFNRQAFCVKGGPISSWCERGRCGLRKAF